MAEADAADIESFAFAMVYVAIELFLSFGF